MACRSAGVTETPCCTSRSGHRRDVGQIGQVVEDQRSRRSAGTPPSAAAPRSWRRRSGSCRKAARLRGSGSCPSFAAPGLCNRQTANDGRRRSVARVAFSEVPRRAQAAGSAGLGSAGGWSRAGCSGFDGPGRTRGRATAAYGGPNSRATPSPGEPPERGARLPSAGVIVGPVGHRRMERERRAGRQRSRSRVFAPDLRRRPARFGGRVSV